MKSHSIAAQASGDRSLQVPDHLLAPALFQALFWKPRFMIHSPVTVHVPLFHWLSCVMRPQSVSILGANDGMAHFAFCQALDRLGIGGQCKAFGFWHDARTGKGVASPPAHLMEHQEMLYEGLSEVMACASLDEALDRIRPATVDLLFCDLAALPRDARISCETLLSCLSTPSVLLLHGTNKARQDRADIASRFPDNSRHVDFPEGNGLTLICNGGDLPGPLQSLLDTAAGGILRRDVEQVFRRSGQGLRAIATETAHIRARQHAEEAAADARKALQQMQKELSDLRELHDLRSVKFGKTQREVFDLRHDLEKLAKNADMARQARDKTSAMPTAVQAEDAALHNRLEAERSIRFDTTEEASADGTGRHDAAGSGADSVQQTRSQDPVALVAAQAEAASARNGLKAEQKIRFEETLMLTQISEELRNNLENTEAALVERTRERDAAHLEMEAAQRALTSAQANAEAAKAELLAERHTRFEETAALTRIAEDLRRQAEAAIQAAKAQLSAERQENTRQQRLLTQVAENLRGQLKQAQRQRDRLHKHNQELLSSTSWRITAPIRAIKTKLSLRPRRKAEPSGSSAPDR